MKDASNNPIVGDGSKLNPTKLFVTSLKLLKFCDTSNQNFMGMFHVDGTYRIVQNRFPMAVFGRSDINRNFFPIALALLSTEEAINYSDLFFNTPPGYATTNNPEESFNKVFKAAYTNNERVTMGRVCDIMCTCVYDYSTTHANQPFALVASRNNAIVNDAKNRYSSANFILVHSNLVNYKNDQGEVKYYITFSPRFCSCPWFLDVANCRHYIAACILL